MYFTLKIWLMYCRINSTQPWIQLHLSHEQPATREYSVAIPVAVNFANQLNRMIKRRLPHFITENGKININKYRSRTGSFDMIELILGEKGVDNYFTKKCVYSSYEMENVNISYWFFFRECYVWGNAYFIVHNCICFHRRILT